MSKSRVLAKSVGRAIKIEGSKDLKITLRALHAQVSCPFCQESHTHFCGWEQEHDVFRIHENTLQFCDRYECESSGSLYRIRSGLECESCTKREVDCLFTPVLEVFLEPSTKTRGGL